MPFQCDECGERAVTYDDANESSCEACGATVPNAELPVEREREIRGEY